MDNINRSHAFPAVVVVCCFILQSCAFSRRGIQMLPVTSNPAGAKVIVDGADRGGAPLYLRLKRREGHVIRIEKDGYEPCEIRITSNALPKNKEFIGSIISGSAMGVIGSALGLVAGALLGSIMVSDEDDKLSAAALGGLVGAFVGSIGLFVLVNKRGPAYELDPRRLDIVLTKAGEGRHTSFFIINTDELENVRWISICCSEGEK